MATIIAVSFAKSSRKQVGYTKRCFKKAQNFLYLVNVALQTFLYWVKFALQENYSLSLLITCSEEIDPFFSPTKLLKFDFSKKAPYSKLWLIFLTQIKSKVCRKLPPIHWRAHSFWFGNFEYLLANFEKVWRDCQEKKKSKWTKSWLSRPFCWVLFESKNH